MLLTQKVGATHLLYDHAFVPRSARQQKKSHVRPKRRNQGTYIPSLSTEYTLKAWSVDRLVSVECSRCTKVSTCVMVVVCGGWGGRWRGPCVCPTPVCVHSNVPVCACKAPACVHGDVLDAHTHTSRRVELSWSLLVVVVVIVVLSWWLPSWRFGCAQQNIEPENCAII